MGNWQKIAEESIWNGWRKLVRWTFAMPDGRTIEYEIKQEGDTVCVVALTSNQEVILAKQFRPGPQAIISELPGGLIDSNEEPVAAGARELLEETGYAGDFQVVGASLGDAYSTMIKHVVVATNCHKIQDPKTDPNEVIETVLMPIEKFREHLRSGQLTDVSTGYMALDFLHLL